MKRILKYYIWWLLCWWGQWCCLITQIRLIMVCCLGIHESWRLRSVSDFIFRSWNQNINLVIIWNRQLSWRHVSRTRYGLFIEGIYIRICKMFHNGRLLLALRLWPLFIGKVIYYIITPTRIIQTNIEPFPVLNIFRIIGLFRKIRYPVDKITFYNNNTQWLYNQKYYIFAY